MKLIEKHETPSFFYASHYHHAIYYIFSEYPSFRNPFLNSLVFSVNEHRNDAQPKIT